MTEAGTRLDTGVSTPSTIEKQASIPTAVMPRLSIVHFLLWTAFTGLAMVCVFSNIFALPPVDETAKALSKALYALLAAANGAALTGLVVLSPFCFSAEKRRQLQAGHWILLAWGVYALCECATNAGVGIWLFNTGSIYSYRHLMSALTALQRGSMVFFAVAGAASTRGDKPWLIYFALKSVAAAIALVIGGAELVTYIGTCFSLSHSELLEMIVFPLLLGLSSLIEFGAFVALLVAAIIDLTSANRRDFLHYVGVALVLAYPLLAAANWFGMSLYYSMARG